MLKNKNISKLLTAINNIVPKCSIKFLILFFVFTASFVIDRITKFLILSLALKAKTIDSTQDFVISVLPFFNLTLVINDGVSFGIFSGLGARYYLVAISFAISVLLIFLAVKEKLMLNKTAYCLVIAGAFGNLFDRISTVRGVVDFLDFFISINNIQYHWPAFNIADSSIFIGVCILIYSNIVSKNLSKQNETI